MKNEYIELINISKSFGVVNANDCVNLSVMKGEIHAILGENGSGKSTLMNILSGIYMPDSGEIRLNGKPIQIRSPKEALGFGIGMIHQHYKLVDAMSAKENIAGGMKGKLFLQASKLTEEILAIGAQYGFKIDPNKRVYRMSVSEKQTVEILKVLYRGARILILDEPTAVLAPQETAQLFQILKKMKQDGCSILFITHKLNEVFELSDRVSVLRKGRHIATIDTDKTSLQEITEMMVGRPIDLNIVRPELPQEQKHLVLRLDHVNVNGPGHAKLLKDVSLDVYSHEILGVAGVAGSGQKELCEILGGIARPHSGSICFNGQETAGLTPRDLHKAGSVGFVPEDRLGMGLAGGLSILDNVILKSYFKTNGIFIDKRTGGKKADGIVKKYSIDTPGIHQTVRYLSGGNIQKILLGREIDLDPDLLITAYPVRGLDIGSSYFIYDQLNEQKQKGVAVIFVGEDLDILLSLSDRIAILHAGKLMSIVDPKQATKEQIGFLMMGHTGGGRYIA